jgi:hypothetical protein
MSEQGEEADMATSVDHKQASVGTGGEGVIRVAPGDAGRPVASRLTTERVWDELAKASFAVLSQVTGAGEPRSSGVVCKTVGGRLYVAVAPDSWKARHIGASRRVAVTVPVRRGGILSLVAPIPPATISFPRHRDRPPGRLAEGPLAVEGAGIPAASRAAGLQLHHRDRPRGRVPDLRRGRLPVEDAHPGRGSRTRASDPRESG